MQGSLELDHPELEQTPQRVCVTVGSGGLGLAIASAFHAEDAMVHVAEASPQRLAEVLGEHPGMHGSVTDVSQPEEVEAMAEEALAWMGGLDVLVNCAMVEGPRASLDHIDYEDWDRTLRVNLSGMFYCMKQVIPVLRSQQSGCIVNVASTSARTGLPLRSAFVASMAGVLGLTQNAARELGPDQVRCNAVLPGVLLDDQARALVEARARERRISLEEAEAELLSHVSMRSWIEESEVAETVLFLASDRARHVTGQTIGVCGNVEWEG